MKVSAKRVVSYIGTVYLFVLGILFFGGGIFFGFISGWNFDGFDAMSLVNIVIGIIFLIFGIIQIFIIKGHRWAEITQKILLIVFAVCFVFIIIGGIILSR